ncbi:hypothetical protein GMRT_14075 [Giardia muris]|uniref:Uncharacterized protein n=1 Tax=Giardia muris TaxID=5742 RepID=A0A4Z1T9R2_GIAMU|nr:hypothetical protein GMRT_14075 [Giardia muris]|eukprot:TNJ29281.1 hypothetical protein GMRT_14075 [Giardia muris]
MTDISFPSSLRPLLLQRKEDQDIWLSERKMNYPTAKNRACREAAQQALKESGAYVTNPQPNRFKPEYEQRVITGKAGSHVIVAQRAPSLLDRLRYSSIRKEDSLLLEILTFIRKENWFDPPADGTINSESDDSHGQKDGSE